MQDIAEFKRNNELMIDGDAGDGDGYEEIDLRAEDDALVAAELEAAALEAERERATEERRGETEEERDRNSTEPAADAEEEEDDGDQPATRRRRSRRGARGRRSAARAGAVLEGTFDHGEEGYGLWLDPAIQDDPVYAEHWAGQRPVEVVVEEEQIVIRRAREGS
ncbi:MAG: hypothetical protein ACYCUM_02835 [Solirubrobacteraceae bacterium]